MAPVISTRRPVAHSPRQDSLYDGELGRPKLHIRLTDIRCGLLDVPAAGILIRSDQAYLYLLITQGQAVRIVELLPYLAVCYCMTR